MQALLVTVLPLPVRLALCLCVCISYGHAQSSCSSDGQPRPVALAERFIDADCENCWQQADASAAQIAPGTLVLDWIVPSAQGEGAALYASATRDSLERLQMLNLTPPSATASTLHKTKVTAHTRYRVRVGHGLPLVNYVGTSIEMSPPAPGPWLAVLLLVEEIPAGSDGTPVTRHLVRNMLVTPWHNLKQHGDPARRRWLESRPMSLPDGTRFSRLHAVGWVQNARGQIVGMARSACVPIR